MCNGPQDDSTVRPVTTVATVRPVRNDEPCEQHMDILWQSECVEEVTGEIGRRCRVVHCR